MTDKITNHSQENFEDAEKRPSGASTTKGVSGSMPEGSPDTHDFIQDELEKEIKELEDKYQLNPDFNFETGFNTPVERWIFIKAKLSQHIATKQAMINKIKTFPFDEYTDIEIAETIRKDLLGELK